MICKEIISKLEQLCPPQFAQSWDNVGLLTGDCHKDIKTVYIGLDATDKIIEFALEKKADLLITHHPLLFQPLKRLVRHDFVARLLIELIKNDVCYYAMHTNFDVCIMGDIAARKLHLQSPAILETTYEEEGIKEGFGRVGQLPKVMTLSECADYVKDCFGLEHVKVFGELDKVIRTAAILPGSGKSMINAAIKEGADVFITGDTGHHDGIDANLQGMAVIDAGHYGMEQIFIPYMADFMQKQYKDMKVYTEPQQNPFFIL